MAALAGNDDRNDRERAKAIDLAVGQFEKQFGKGSIMRLGQKDVIAQMPSISTGSVSLDYALGIGGVPRGRVIEIFGPESSGKTTLSVQLIAEAQKLGGMAAFVDAEHALDAQYARKLGVDLDNLLVSQPDNGEQALEIVEVLVRSGGVDVIVVDSVAALVPRAEIEGEMGEAQMGLQARLMSQALRKLTGIVSKSKTCLIFINQLREKIGVMFGNPETTTGGRALKFYSSVVVSGLPNMTPIFSRSWLMKIRQVFDFETMPVSLRSACDMRRACRPICASPISPSISARGTSAATESTTMTSTPPERTSTSTISSACSPLSGCDTSRLSRSTPSFRAYCASSACSASTNAAIPPSFCASAISWTDSVVLPDDSGPKISMTRPRGTPPTPRAKSMLMAPVGIVSIGRIAPFCPRRMIEPLPNCFSIWRTARSTALTRSRSYL